MARVWPPPQLTADTVFPRRDVTGWGVTYRREGKQRKSFMWLVLSVSNVKNTTERDRRYTQTQREIDTPVW